MPAAIRADSLSRNLDEVTVTASTIERKGNRERIVITRDMRQGAVNTIQMLGNIQGMFLNRVDNSLRYMGSDKIIILVDSMERDLDYVRNLNHVRFDKIDIIHHPSGKYSDYDLVINLRRKELYEGYEGDLSGGADLYAGNRNGHGHNMGHGNIHGAFTYTRSKWNFFIQHNYDWLDRASSQHAENIYPLNDFRDMTIPNTDGSPNQRNYARNGGTYLGIDYDINKHHSLSLTYYLGTTSIDNYNRSTMLSGRIDGLDSDTLRSSVTFRDKGYRHTVGFYYRGRSGLWSYNANFNLTANGWRTWSHNQRSSGFMLEDNRRNRQNYIWGNAEVSRRSADGKWHLSLGYMNYWKEFWIKRLSTLDLLSTTLNRRNDFYLSASFNPSSSWSAGLSGSLMMVSNQSGAVSEHYLLNSISAWGFHRFSSKAWARINYYSFYNQPSIDQISDYGQFTDSLQWSGGNPALRAFTSHRISISSGLFNIFNIEASAFFAPKAFASIAEMQEGQRPDGTYGTYVATRWQNTDMRQWTVAISAQKGFGNFNLNAYIRWFDIRAKYLGYRSHQSGPTGSLVATYIDNPRQLYIQLNYQAANSYNATPQSYGKTESDAMTLYIQKSFLRGRLTATCAYTLPLHILSGNSLTIIDSPTLHSLNCGNNQFRTDNSLNLRLAYRFNGGKSVRQYNRQMRND